MAAEEDASSDPSPAPDCSAAPTASNPAAAAEPTHAPELFVIYARADAWFVENYLVPSLGLSADRVALLHDRRLGVPLARELERRVLESRLTLVVLSPVSGAEGWADFAEALATHAAGAEARLVPLVLEGPDPPLRLGFRDALDFRDRARWDEETTRLRRHLQQAAPSVERLPCPYPGLRPFSAAEAGRFYGRAKEVEGLLQRLRAGEREFYLIGPSGSGKSSLVAAGVLPKVEDRSSDFFDVPFVVRTLRLGERPTERLWQALAVDGKPPGSRRGIAAGALPTQPSQAGESRRFRDDIAGGVPTSRAPVDAASLSRAIDALLSAAGAGRVLLFVDQFEELFTLAGLDERRRFVEALGVLRGDARLALVFALRADFFGALMDSDLWPDLEEGFAQVRIAPLRGKALAEAIEEPACALGVAFEPRLVERLLADAANEPGVLPLLQEALRLLWERRHYKLLRLNDYEALGEDGKSGLAVALARHAQATLQALSPSERVVARRMFLQLVSFDEGRPNTRRQRTKAALLAAGEDESEAAGVLGRLTAARLLTANDGESEGCIDLAHEVIITAWPALQGWLGTWRADEERRRSLERKVHEWAERGRGNASLLDAVELTEAEQWVKSDAARELGYTRELPALIAASRAKLEEEEQQRQETERRENQRIRQIIGVLVLFVVGVSGLGLMAWSKSREAEAQKGVAETRQQEASRLLGQTYREQGRQLVLKGRPLAALPYLVAARQQGVDDSALRMLFAKASRNGWLQLRHDNLLNSASFSPDGARVVTASAGNTARVWDAASGRPLSPPLEHQGQVNSASFSPDGARVVTASWDKTARVWDVASGRPLSPSLEHQGQVASASFSPDGARVVTASDDNTARVWDAASGEPLTPPLEHQNLVRSASFSPDGARVVTASWDKTARVWDAASGRPLSLPLEHQNWVQSASFSPDGARVVTASDDNAARVWDVSLDSAPLEKWTLRAHQCSPYTLDKGLLLPTPLTSGICPKATVGAPLSEALARRQNLIALGHRRLHYPHGEAYRSHREVAYGFYREALVLAEIVGDRKTAVEASWSLALLAAIEGDLDQARRTVGAEAPAQKGALLNVLAGFAQDTLHEPALARELLQVASECEPNDASILLNQAENFFALRRYADFRKAARRALRARDTPSRRVVVSVLEWAAGRLTAAAGVDAATRLLRGYDTLRDGEGLDFLFQGTRHVLRYGTHPFEDVRPILELLEELEKPVSEETRARVRALLLASPAK